MLGNCSINQVMKAIVGRQHYIALFNMIRIYPSFFDSIYRYLTARGTYPYNVSIRTPTGSVAARLYSHHDLLTVNEIFCRLDYPAGNSIRVVVDVGSNIGISALFFLSRNSFSKCYLFEPDPRNIERLKRNLTTFENRYVLHDKAVSHKKGKFEFGLESTGRYGGIGVKGEKTIIVDCLEINELIENVLSLKGNFY